MLKQVKNLFKIEGHRGYGLNIPGNTMESFRACVQNNLSSIELDVWLSQDQKIVVLHGDDLSQGIIQIDGEDKFIWDVTALDIMQKFKVGGNDVPLLDNVLNEYADKIRVNIELKGYWKQPLLIDKVLDLVYANNYQDKVILSSFNHSYYFRMLEYIKEKNKNFKPIPFNFVFKYLKSEQNNDQELYQYNGLDLDTVNPLNNGVTTKFDFFKDQFYLDYLRRAKQMGFTLNVYFGLKDLENNDWYDIFVNEGVDYVITNHPEIAKKYLEQQQV